MIREAALATSSATVGFTSRTAVNTSPEMLRKTRLAVARAKEGDQEALRFLYVSYSNNIYGYVRSIVRDDHEAEDVTQHVFAKLITTIAKYDDRGVPFFAWLLRMARNVAIDHLRANRLTPTENVLDPDLEHGAGPRPHRDRARGTRRAARGAAPGRRSAPRRRAHARRDRRPDGTHGGRDPWSSPPWPPGPPARVDPARVDSGYSGAQASPVGRLVSEAAARSAAETYDCAAGSPTPGTATPDAAVPEITKALPPLVADPAGCRARPYQTAGPRLGRLGVEHADRLSDRADAV